MMNTSQRSELQTLIDRGLLIPGDELHTDAGDIKAVIVSDGIKVGGRVYDDPSTAMLATGLKIDQSLANGWLFWQLPDNVRGYVKPLEHLRVAMQASEQAHHLKTSESHPLRIDFLSVGDLPGKLGMTLCPGKQGNGLYGGTWRRNLTTDLEAIYAQNGRLLITVLEPHEFSLLGVDILGSACAQHDIEWTWLSIRDSDVPSAEVESIWPALSQRISSILTKGQNVVIHCRGGLGRTGVIAARFLVDRGFTASAAISAVRASRPGAIETWSQEQHVLSYGSHTR